MSAIFRIAVDGDEIEAARTIDPVLSSKQMFVSEIPSKIPSCLQFVLEDLRPKFPSPSRASRHPPWSTGLCKS